MNYTITPIAANTMKVGFGTVRKQYQYFSATLKIPARRRTILVNHISETNSFFLPFPELKFVITYYKNVLFHVSNVNVKFIIENEEYIAPLPNTDSCGNVCMGRNEIISFAPERLLKRTLELFWSVPFDGTIPNCLVVYFQAHSLTYQDMLVYDKVKYILNLWSQNKLPFLKVA